MLKIQNPCKCIPSHLDLACFPAENAHKWVYKPLSNFQKEHKCTRFHQNNQLFNSFISVKLTFVAFSHYRYYKYEPSSRPGNYHSLLAYRLCSRSWIGSSLHKVGGLYRGEGHEWPYSHDLWHSVLRVSAREPECWCDTTGSSLRSGP